MTEKSEFVRDLTQLPLIHGSVLLDESWDAIQREGLLAGGGRGVGINTFDLDISFGRNQSVFLEPFRAAGGYGFGHRVIVHPTILCEAECSAFLVDPGRAGELFDQIRNCWQFGPRDFTQCLDDVVDDGLADILSRLESTISQDANEAEWARSLQNLVRESMDIREYYESKRMSVHDLYVKVESECTNRNWAIADYIDRGETDWPFSEEILVIGRVPPEYILGRLRGRDWTPRRSSRAFSQLPGYLEMIGINL